MQSTRGLRTVQEESVQRLYFSLIDSGWPEDDIALAEGPSIVRVENGKPRIVYDQALIDERIRLRFTQHRDRLPASCRVHQLPIDRVGALAAMNLDAFVGFTASEADDFIAIAYGTFKLRLWGIVTANTDGAEVYPPPLTAAGQPATEEWWQSSILPMASDILGYRWDHDRGHHDNGMGHEGGRCWGLGRCQLVFARSVHHPS